MNTIEQNLSILVLNKTDIKNALIYAGMQPTDDMSTYAQLVRNVADMNYSNDSNGARSIYNGELYIPGNVGLKIYGLSRLQCSKIELGEGITYIPNYCFYPNYCRLTILPSTITNIGSQAIRAMLDSVVILKATTPPTVTTSSFSVYSAGLNFTIYVPDGSLADYQNATNWANYVQYLKPISEYVEN